MTMSPGPCRAELLEIALEKYVVCPPLTKSVSMSATGHDINLVGPLTHEIRLCCLDARLAELPKPEAECCDVVCFVCRKIDPRRLITASYRDRRS